MNHEADDELDEVLREVRRIEVQSRRLVKEMMAGGYCSVFRGSGIEFDEVREYVEGDDPRGVDWNVTARMGRPYIKKYVDERELSVFFVLDLSPSMGGGFGRWSVRQMAARVIAALAFSAAGNNDKVGFVACGGDVETYVPLAKGKGHVLRIIRDALLLPGANRFDLLPGLARVSRVARRRSIVFILSDFLHGGFDDPLALCARKHDVTAVRILPPELEPPPTSARLVRLREPETGRDLLVDWGSPATRRAWRSRVDDWNRDVTESLRRANVDRMEVPLPRDPDTDAVARPILDFFRMRSARGAKR